MKILSIDSNRIITPKTTGWTAAAGLGITAISGLTENKTIRKLHKPAAIITTIATAVHIGLIEYYSHKFKK